VLKSDGIAEDALERIAQFTIPTGRPRNEKNKNTEKQSVKQDGNQKLIAGNRMKWTGMACSCGGSVRVSNMMNLFYFFNRI